MAALTAWRAWLFWRFGVPGWGGWAFGSLALLGIAALIRHWARYEIFPTRLVVRNGYTGHEISQVELSQIDQVKIRQGKVASLLGIGTVVVLSGEQPALRLRGVNDPDEVKRRIESAIRTSAYDRMSRSTRPAFMSQ
jgi:membrane protein YdbS with pleckstrin-like domain